MLGKIPWDKLTPHNSPAVFKRLKDEILKLRDEGLALATFKELESILRHRLPADIKFADAHLDTLLTLPDGPGLVKQLGFGTYILLRPEWINVYAQAVSVHRRNQAAVELMAESFQYVGRPAGFLRGLAQRRQGPPPMLVIDKDFFPPVPAIHHVIGKNNTSIVISDPLPLPALAAALVRRYS